jgi:hypothetical protein
VKARASKTLEQARKTGTAKQQEKAAALVQKYGGSANQAKTPALDLTAKELEDGFEWVRRLPAKVYGQPIYAYLSQYYEDRRPSLYVSFIDRDGEETNVQAGRLDSVRGKPMSYSVPRSSGFGREGIKPHDLAGWLNDRLGNRPVDKTARLDVLNRRLDSAIQADDKYWMSRLGALVERIWDTTKT